nr:MAG TPA: hypothetical protein [Caudoviricetes sp.]
MPSITSGSVGVPAWTRPLRGTYPVFDPITFDLAFFSSTISAIVTPNAFASFSMAPIRGCDQPDSHWVTVALETPTRSASCACVISASSLSLRIFSESPIWITSPVNLIKHSSKISLTCLCWFN